jgi:hypothetical protein
VAGAIATAGFHLDLDPHPGVGTGTFGTSGQEASSGDGANTSDTDGGADDAEDAEGSMPRASGSGDENTFERAVKPTGWIGAFGYDLWLASISVLSDLLLLPENEWGPIAPCGRLDADFTLTKAASPWFM